MEGLFIIGDHYKVIKVNNFCKDELTEFTKKKKKKMN